MSSFDTNQYVGVRFPQPREPGLRMDDRTLTVLKKRWVCTEPLRNERGNGVRGWTEIHHNAVTFDIVLTLT